MRALGDVFVAHSDSRDVRQIITRTALDMLEKWIEPEITPEELNAVLATSARAAARSDITSRSSLARKLRRRTAELLFDALAAGHPWCREPLERMRDCPAISKLLRKDIAGRLSRTLAIAQR